ncbi:AraC family transcriptional regulator [Paenibacillus sp. J5C_2022]|uniref:AraC family transcriptional regulator n=1 Tax=Paenibacillus sp. J5C2022 TaxID=2977129 RepID=UPI0021CECC73|nr:AraC family transcriptional regulator [Paenibacillus sp. J5C2022]MCU6709702.1 AraC family transcriptional regulator [Paenibacillus sp. J5C2022]
MEFLTMAHLSRLDVKWANIHKGNSDFYRSTHSNPYYEILIVIEGPIYMQVGNERLVLKSGELFLLRPWEAHSGWRETSEESCFFWIQFQCDPKLEEFKEWTKAIGAIHFIHDAQSDLRTHFDENIDKVLLPRRFRPQRRHLILSQFENIIHQFAHPTGYFRFRLSLLLGNLFETIADDLLEEDRHYRTVSASFFTYRNLISMLNENFAKSIDRNWIERETGRKYEYLCQVFKKNSGISISSYVQQLRIQKAKYLLINTSLSIQGIGEEVGYQDALYFSRVFKKLSGESPSQYREQSGNGS